MSNNSKDLKIFIGNDDGVGSIGIDVLARYIQEIGDIKIVCPMYQQTARAKSLTFHKPIRIQDTTTQSGFPALAYNSTPAVGIIFHNHF